MSALDELSESLDAFDELVSKDMNTLHRESDPETHRTISELMTNTRPYAEQKKLLEDTTRAKERGQDAFEKTLQDNARAALDKIAQDLVATEQNIKTLQKRTESGQRSSRLEKLAQETDSILNALERMNLPRAIEQTKAAEEISRRLTWDRRSPDHRMDQAVNESLIEARLKCRSFSIKLKKPDALLKTKCSSTNSRNAKTASI